jgi:hypothetical protein
MGLGRATFGAGPVEARIRNSFPEPVSNTPETPPMTPFETVTRLLQKCRRILFSVRTRPVAGLFEAGLRGQDRLGIQFGLTETGYKSDCQRAEGFCDTHCPVPLRFPE